jgi:N-terminal domain of oxidoreductase
LPQKQESWIASLRSQSRNRKNGGKQMSQAKRVVLVSRPVGEPKPSDFRVEDYTPPTPGEGQVLLRTIWLSLDPYMRGRMSDGPSYAAPVPIGGVMEGGTVSAGRRMRSRTARDWQKSIRNSHRSPRQSACSACPA